MRMFELNDYVDVFGIALVKVHRELRVGGGRSPNCQDGAKEERNDLRASCRGHRTLPPVY